MKRIITWAAATTLAALCACATPTPDVVNTPTPPSPTPTPEPVVAVIGEQRILAAEFEGLLDAWLAEQGLGDKYAALVVLGQTEVVGELRRACLADVVGERLIAARAQADGWNDITQADRDAAALRAGEMLDETLQMYTRQVTAEAVAWPETGDARKAKIAVEAQARFDSEVTQADREAVAQTALEQVVEQRIRGQVLALAGGAPQATPEAAQAEYARLGAEQKLLYDNNPEAFAAELERIYAGDLAEVICYRPVAYRLIKHAMVALPADQVAYITDLYSRGQDAEAEAYYTAAMAAIHSQGLLLRGEVVKYTNFDNLIERFSQDEDSFFEPVRTNGYVVTQGTSPFGEAFSQAAFNLDARGRYSGLIETPYGYHILYCNAILPQGDVAFEEVEALLTAKIAAQLQAQAIRALTQSWYAEQGVVVYLESL